MFSRKSDHGDLPKNSSGQIERLRRALRAWRTPLIIGAGAGLSASAGLTYEGERFREPISSDFRRKSIRIQGMQIRRLLPLD